MLLFTASPKIELTEYLDYKLDSPVTSVKQRRQLVKSCKFLFYCFCFSIILYRHLQTAVQWRLFIASVSHICSKAITAKSTSRYFHFFHCDFHKFNCSIFDVKKISTVYFMSVQPNYCTYSIVAAFIINCFSSFPSFLFVIFCFPFFC